MDRTRAELLSEIIELRAQLETLQAHATSPESNSPVKEPSATYGLEMIRRRSGGPPDPASLKRPLRRVKCPGTAGRALLKAANDTTPRKVEEEQADALQAQVLREKDWPLSVIDSMADPVWFVGKQADVKVANRSLLQELHLTPDSMPDARWPALRALNGETVRDFEFSIQNPATGDLRHLQVDAAPVRTKNGDIFGAVSVARDISDRKQIESAKERLKALIDHSPSLVFMKDQEGRYVYLNEPFLKRFPEAKNWYGRTDLEVLPREAAELYRANDAEVLKKGEPQQFLEDSTDEDGTRRCWLCYKFPFTDSSNCRYVGAISFDVTGRVLVEEALRRREEELRSAHVELERRVEERTAELRAAIREQESFSYSVSHDLRAPLRHINSFCAILAEDHGAELSAEARQYILRMREASNQMGQLIDHLLKLSRVQRAELQVGKVSLSEIAEATLQMLRETEPGRSVECHVEPGLIAHGDKYLLTQVLSNLIGNAWKYTARKPHAVIVFGRSVHDGETTYFVRDNGAGFNMSYCDKLFQPFERLHGSEFEGAGIGLATVQRIVLRHGGRIWAEGEENAGATIYFTLRTGPRKKSPR